jgi:hypothetical protein
MIPVPAIAKVTVGGIFRVLIVEIRREDIGGNIRPIHEVAPLMVGPDGYRHGRALAMQNAAADFLVIANVGMTSRLSTQTKTYPLSNKPPWYQLPFQLYLVANASAAAAWFCSMLSE